MLCLLQLNKTFLRNSKVSNLNFYLNRCKILLTKQLKMFGGSKPKESKPASVEVQTNNKPAEPQKKSEEPAFSLGTILDSVESSYLSVKKSYNENKEQFKKSQVYTTMLSWKNSTTVNFCVPLSDSYRKLPYKITDWKFDLINGYTYGERLMIVNTVSLFTAIFAFRRFQATALVGTSLRAIKNTAFMYLGAGLIIAPQIYNPIIKSTF